MRDTHPPFFCIGNHRPVVGAHVQDKFLTSFCCLFSISFRLISTACITEVSCWLGLMSEDYTQQASNCSYYIPMKNQRRAFGVKRVLRGAIQPKQSDDDEQPCDEDNEENEVPRWCYSFALLAPLILTSAPSRRKKPLPRWSWWSQPWLADWTTSSSFSLSMGFWFSLRIRFISDGEKRACTVVQIEIINKNNRTKSFLYYLWMMILGSNYPHLFCVFGLNGWERIFSSLRSRSRAHLLFCCRISSGSIGRRGCVDWKMPWWILWPSQWWHSKQIYTSSSLLFLMLYDPVVRCVIPLSFMRSLG